MLFDPRFQKAFRIGFIIIALLLAFGMVFAFTPIPNIQRNGGGITVDPNTAITTETINTKSTQVNE